MVLKKFRYVENVLSVANAAELLKDTASQKLNAIPVFDSTLHSQERS